MEAIEHEKRMAAEAAADLVPSGSIVGLGTGSTAAYLLLALRERDLQLTCVATSVQTEHAARALGLSVVPFSELERLDIAIDGADQIARDGWVIKGGGGAHTREKIVAAAAERYVIIASSNKRVERLTPPVPVELLGFGAGATLRKLAPVTLRGIQASPDGGLIADYHGAIADPRALGAWLETIPGLVGHGLFEPELIDDILVARDGAVEHFRPVPGKPLECR